MSNIRNDIRKQFPEVEFTPGIGYCGPRWAEAEAIRQRIVYCVDCGCELLRHPDEPVTAPKRCSTCWRKAAR